MRVRFLQTVDSGVEGFPFMPGQVITVNKPSPWLLSYIDGVHAVRLTDEDVAAATEPTAPEPEPLQVATVAPVAETAAVRHGRKGRR